jgi:hypothetical protein
MGKGATAGSADRPDARVYLGSTRGGADSRGPQRACLPREDALPREALSYGPPWAHCLGGYQDRILGGPLGLPDLHCTSPDGVKHKDYRGEVHG